MEITSVEVRVRYGETDQMGVAYHSHYLVWCDVARTDHLRQQGVSYRALEEQGLRLAVVEAQIRYGAPARFDDLVRLRCWVRDLASRRVVFGYAIERPADGAHLATAQTALIAIDRRHAVTRLPPAVVRALKPVPDPIRIIPF